MSLVVIAVYAAIGLILAVVIVRSDFWSQASRIPESKPALALLTALLTGLFALLAGMLWPLIALGFLLRAGVKR